MFLIDSDRQFIIELILIKYIEGAVKCTRSKCKTRPLELTTQNMGNRLNLSYNTVRNGLKRLKEKEIIEVFYKYEKGNKTKKFYRLGKNYIAEVFDLNKMIKK